LPLLVLVMDPIRAAAVLLPILIAQDVVGVWVFRRDFDFPTLKLMVPGALIGIVAGWALASVISSKGVGAMVGLIALTFGLNRLLGARGWGVKLKGQLPRWLGMLCGGVSGFTSQVAHAGGPPYQIWALTRNFSTMTYAGTSAIFFAIINWAKVPAYLALGQFTAANTRLTLVFLPLAVLSTLAGAVLVKRISPVHFQLAINGIMVLVGLELLRDAAL
jgi:uncharacterized protein